MPTNLSAEVNAGLHARSDVKAPANDDGVLFSPPLPTWPKLLCQQYQQAKAIDETSAGFRLGSFAIDRQAARQRLIQLAHHYLANFDQEQGDAQKLQAGRMAESQVGSAAPIIMCGHQPSLFHAGVWIKGIAIGLVARKCNAIAIHLLADNDLSPGSNHAVLTGSADQPMLTYEAFDSNGSAVPIEDWRVHDESAFRSFGDRVHQHLEELGDTPIMREYWQHVLAHANVTPKLGERISAGRRAIERAFGINNLELPMSIVARTPEFRRFLVGMLLHADQFAQTHHRALARVRADRSISNLAQPFPDLATESDGWIETPFWIWRQPTENSRQHSIERGRLFVQRDRNTIRLRADAHTIVGEFDELSLTDLARDAGNATPSEQSLAELLPGWKIRPRAVTLTLYARTVLCDLFVHGIGGGVYDQVTDHIIAELTAQPVPAFAIATATYRLPAAQFHDLEQQHHQLVHRLRDLEWNPQRYLSDQLVEREPICQWVEQKLALMEQSPPTRRERIARFEAFRELNRKLRPYVETQLNQARSQLRELEAILPIIPAVRSREYPFCYFSRGRLTRLVESVKVELNQPA